MHMYVYMYVYIYTYIHTHTYVGYIAIGLFKQGRESDFCFGKQDPGHRSEQLFFKHREGLDSKNRGQAFLGRDQGLPAWPGVPAVGLSVTATHTAGSVVARAGPQAWPRGTAHFLLSSPLCLCAVGSGTENRGGLAR